MIIICIRQIITSVLACVLFLVTSTSHAAQYGHIAYEQSEIHDDIRQIAEHANMGLESEINDILAVMQNKYRTQEDVVQFKNCIVSIKSRLLLREDLLQQLLQYAASNQDDDIIKIFIDVLANPGLYSITDNNDQPLNIFIFGSAHTLPYTILPQHISNKLEAIAATRESQIFSEVGGDNFYDDTGNNIIPKGLLIYWDLQKQIEIDMEEQTKQGAMYEEKTRIRDLLDKYPSLYPNLEAASAGYQEDIARLKQELQDKYGHWDRIDDELIKRIGGEAAAEIAKMAPTIQVSDQEFIRTLPKNLQGKINNCDMDFYRVQLSDIHPRFIENKITPVLLDSQRGIISLDEQISNLFVGVKTALDSEVLRQNVDEQEHYDHLLKKDNQVLWYYSNVVDKILELFDNIQKIKDHIPVMKKLHEIDYQDPIIFDYLFHSNRLPNRSHMSLNMRNKVWWQNKIKPLIDTKLSGTNVHNPVLIMYGCAHHSNQDKMGILDFIKNYKGLKIKRLLPDGRMELINPTRRDLWEMIKQVYPGNMLTNRKEIWGKLHQINPGKFPENIKSEKKRKILKDLGA